MININLSDAPSNCLLEIIDIKSGPLAKKRLISMGLHIGDKIIKYNGSNWCPVLVKNVTLNASKIALGRKIAEKITVSYEAS